MVGLVALLVGVLVVLVVRFVIAYVRFRRLELSFPGPLSLPILGNALDFIGISQDNLLQRAMEVAGHHNETSRVSILGNLILVINSPDGIQKIIRTKETQNKARFIYELMDMYASGLITLNGAKWRAHRKAIEPAFHTEVLSRFIDVFYEESEGFVQRVQPGVEQDVIDNLNRMSAGSFFRTALDSNSGEEEENITTLLRCMHAITRSLMKRSLQFWLWPDAVYRLTSEGRYLEQIKREGYAVTDRVIRKHREALGIGARDSEGGESDFIKQRRTLVEVLLDPKQDSGMDDDDIKGEINTFMAASVETTTATLGFVLKILSVRQDIQDRVREEAFDVLGNEGSVSMQSLARLEYTERVVKETLRLVPSIPGIGRSNPVDFEFCGRTIPAHSTVEINIMSVHRDQRQWPDPLVFDPDRFLPQRSVGRHPYAFIPFSTGPRGCIGKQYAMMFMKTFVSTLVRRYSLQPVDDGLTDPASFPLALDGASRLIGGVRIVLTPHLHK